MTHYCILNTSLLGDLLLVADSAALKGVYYADCRHAPAPHKDWRRDRHHPVLAQAGEEIQAYLRGDRSGFGVLRSAAGTAFQQRVWRQIAGIPFGETISYTELARRAGAPGAVRAAGAATGQNPLSIVVPCHRVVGKNGALTGYAGGVERKRRLLAVEGR